MRSLILSLTLLLPLLVGAQGFGSFSHDQPFLAKDASGGDAGPVATYYWDFRDLATNAAVRDWEDRNGATHATNAVGMTYYPTNTAEGVRWRILAPPMSLSLTNSDFFMRSNGAAIWMLVKWGAPLGGSRPFIVDSTGAQQNGVNNTPAWYESSVLASPVSTSAYCDYCIAWGNPGQSYTNGISSATYTQGAPWLVDKFGGTYATVDVLEIRYFKDGLTLPDIAFLHNYATNLYGFSP